MSIGSQFAIDFSQSSIYDLIGFKTIKSFDTDGIFEASDNPVFGTFGDYMSIELTGFGNLSIVNDQSTDVISNVDLTTTGQSNYYTVNKNSTCEIDIKPPYEISTFSVQFIGSRNKTIFFLQREVYLTFNLIEYSLWEMEFFTWTANSLRFTRF